MASSKPKTHTMPTGTLRYPKLNQPDTDYDEDGKYQTDIILDRNEAAVSKFCDWIDKQVDEQFEAAKAEKKTAAEKKKLKKTYPYENEVDDETEEETGRVIFRRVGTKASGFNKSRGERWESRFPQTRLFDAAGKLMTKKIGSGSTAKVAFHVYPYLMESTKMAGISLRLEAVQVIERVEGGASASTFGFGVEGDGEEDDDEGDDEGFSFGGGDDDEGDGDF